jgi:hypothetical protein
MSSTSLVVGRTLSLLAAVAAATTLAGCQRELPKPPATLDPAAFRAEIDKLRAAYEESVANGDSKAMGTLLADGAVMVRPGGREWEAWAAAAGEAPFPPGTKMTIKPIEVVPLNSEWGYEFGTSVTTYTPSGADQPQELRDTYLILFRNTGDGWKAYREVASSAAPPSGWPGV